MMLMAMRLQKTQVPAINKFLTPGSATFRKAPAIMAGYTNFQVMVVGAVGGASGRGGPWTDAYGVQYRESNGGGGGSSKIISGTLNSLADSIAIAVGLQGTTGGNGDPSGAGGRGGNSSFGVLATGYGGYGGYSGGSPYANKGGEGANPDGSPGPVGGWEAVRLPSAGAWNATTLEGSGGGGAQGAGTEDQAYAGANGSGSPYLAAGEAASSWDGVGGGGGGADIGPFVGGPSEKRGTGVRSGTGNGAVVVILS